MISPDPHIFAQQVRLMVASLKAMEPGALSELIGVVEHGSDRQICLLADFLMDPTPPDEDVEEAPP
jgi:hypothetical protein